MDTKKPPVPLNETGAGGMGNFLASAIGFMLRMIFT